MPTPNEELQGFLATLNDEADTAAAAFAVFDAEPFDRWAEVLDQRPEWRRFGTFEEMLRKAKEELYNDPRNSRVIVELVLRYVNDMAVIEGAEFFNPLLEGLAFKVHANVLLVQEHADEALQSIERSLRAFDGQPALEVERAAALLVRAQAQHARRSTVEALESVRDAANIFEAHYQFRFHQMALEICAGILVDQKEYALAQDVYQSAYVTAERLEDHLAILRLETNLGLCAVYLHQPEEARYRLKKALAGWQEENKHEAIQRTIFDLAREARERGDLEEALETMHNVYADFLDRDMPKAAAEVLVELGDTMTQLTGDAAYARDTCHRLADTMTTYAGVPDNIRNAAIYLKGMTANPSSLEVLRKAFDAVRSFLRDLTNAENPTAVAFAVKS